MSFHSGSTADRRRPAEAHGMGKKGCFFQGSGCHSPRMLSEESLTLFSRPDLSGTSNSFTRFEICFVNTIHQRRSFVLSREEHILMTSVQREVNLISVSVTGLFISLVSCFYLSRYDESSRDYQSRCCCGIFLTLSFLEDFKSK